MPNVNQVESDKTMDLECGINFIKEQGKSREVEQYNIDVLRLRKTKANGNGLKDDISYVLN